MKKTNSIPDAVADPAPATGKSKPAAADTGPSTETKQPKNNAAIVKPSNDYEDESWEYNDGAGDGSAAL